MEALWIAIGVVAVLLIAMLLWRAGRERRRQAAAGLRKDAIDREENARQAELAAEEERATAESRRKRADRIDPDSDGSADDDDDVDADSGERHGILDRITNR